MALIKSGVAAALMTLGVAASVPASASLVFTGSAGSLAASAEFNQVGSTLTVTLTNTSLADVLNPAEVLTGVFFTIAGTSLSSGSAILAPGSLVYYDTDGQPAGGNVGGEWGYLSGLAGAPLGASSGISSSGLGLFGGATFNGPNLQDPVALDGVQYGILSAGDNTATGNGGITGSGGLIKNSVVFTLSISDATFLLDVSDITNLSFQYGTALTEPNVPGGCTVNCGGGGGGSVPEPGTLALLGIGMSGLAAIRRRKG